MGSTVKWVFCALFDTISIVKLFHSFEYRKIPPNDSSWRCPLYRSTISKSWIQLLSVSIFQLPNRSPSFRLCHSANEKLLNVYVPHLSINSDSRNCTTNNRFKRSRIFDSKTKIKFQSRTGNTWFKPGIEVWSADRKFWIFFDSHGYERQLILIRIRGFGHVSTPSKHVLLVHMNMLQGLKIHQGLKISHVVNDKLFESVQVNMQPRQLSWFSDRLPTQGFLVRNTGTHTKCVFFWKMTLFENCLKFQNARAIIFPKQTHDIYTLCRIPLWESIAGLPDLQQTRLLTGPLIQYPLLDNVSKCIVFINLYHVSLGDFTTVEMNAVERTLNSSCSQSLARKRDSWKLESMFSKHFSSS